MGDFRMPSLGADMDAGTIVEWRVKPGDSVHRGDVVAVIDTDKADVDAEIFEDGIIGELLVPEGENVPVGTVLATVVTTNAKPSSVEPPSVEPSSEEPAAAAPPQAQPHPPPVLSPVVRHLAEREGVDLGRIHATGAGGRVTRADVEAAGHPTPQPSPDRARISPRARRLARETGVDVGALDGSGPGGAVTGADVEAAGTARPEAAAPPATRDRAVTMRERTSALMERSNLEIPHYWVTRELDFTNSASWLREYNAALPPAQRVLSAALLVAATARAAEEAPTLNGHWIDGELQSATTVDLGLVVALRAGGVLVPVLHDAQNLTLAETMTRLAEVVRRVRSGHLRSTDLGTPTITISNLGDQGADTVLGVIYPPQVALVGFGRITERPWAERGLLGVRQTVIASIAGDHRTSEGHQASRFLATIDAYLQSPERLDTEPVAGKGVTA